MIGYRSPSGRYVYWADLVRDARSAGGRWITAFHDSPATLVRDVRQKRDPRLRHPDGELEAQLRNGYDDDDTGIQRGDVYVRWSDTLTTKEHRMPKGRHDLTIPDQTAAELDALAVLLGLPKHGGRAKAAARVLAEYGEGAPRPSVLDPYSPVRLAVYADDAEWTRTAARADSEGISITAALSEFTTKALDRERQIRREGAGLE